MPIPVPQLQTAPSSSGARFDRLVRLMRALRSPDGCPWDREQTVASLKPYVIEEAYEMADAMDGDDMPALCGEVGDVLFETVFVAQLCAEAGAFAIDDAIDAVTEKLVRRHPHVFGEGATTVAAQEGVAQGPIEAGETASLTPTQVVERWEQIKARERKTEGKGGTVLSGIPKTLPALLRAHEIGSRASAVGFDWQHASDVVAKLEEEVAEIRESVQAGEPSSRVEDEVGDLLFAIANLSRKLGVEPEAALRKANAKFTRRFEAVEARLHSRGLTPRDVDLDALEGEWEAVKGAE